MLLKSRLDMFTYDFVDSYPSINQDVIDQLLETWVRLVDETRKGEQKTVRKTFPTGPGLLGTEKCRELQFCKNKLSVLYGKLRKPNTDVAVVRNDIQVWKSKYDVAARALGKENLEKDMSNMRKYQRVNTKRFFESTGYHLKDDQKFRVPN